MAVPNRLSIDEEFRQANENQNTWGIRNAQLKKMSSGVLRGQAANTPNKPIRQFPNKTLSQYIGPQEAANDNDAPPSPQNAHVAERYYPDNQSAINQNEQTSRSKTTVKTSVAARARGIAFGVTAFSWVLWWFFVWQLPIAIVGAIMLGLVNQIEASYLLTAVDTATQAVGSLFGYEYVDLQGLAMLCIITAAFFGVLSAAICAFTAVLWRLHPLSGNASGTKIATFIVGIIGACIPFANMFPWIVFWILVMMRHPK